MKTAVRLTRLKDGSAVLSLATHFSREELIAASKQVYSDRNTTLPQVMQFAREGNVDLFFCFLRILIHLVQTSK